MSMTKKIKLTYAELFLLEMAIDEVLWKNAKDSAIYRRYDELKGYLFTMRCQLTAGGKKEEEE